jgi:hypothetical protein
MQRRQLKPFSAATAILGLIRRQHTSRRCAALSLRKASRKASAHSKGQKAPLNSRARPI